MCRVGVFRFRFVKVDSLSFHFNFSLPWTHSLCSFAFSWCQQSSRILPCPSQASQASIAGKTTKQELDEADLRGTRKAPTPTTSNLHRCLQNCLQSPMGWGVGDGLCKQFCKHLCKLEGVGVGAFLFPLTNPNKIFVSLFWLDTVTKGLWYRPINYWITVIWGIKLG